MALGVIRRGDCRRGASALGPAAGLKVAQTAEPSAWRCSALAPFVQSETDNVGGKPFREPGEGT